MSDQAAPAAPRRFVLIRDEDVTGISGTGTVSEGVQFTDGRCAMRWRTGTSSTAVYDDIADLVAIHGHGGATRMQWIDTGAEPASRGPRWFAVVPTGTASLRTDAGMPVSIIAEGVEFADGHCLMRWVTGPERMPVTYPSIAELFADVAPDGSLDLAWIGNE